MIDPETDTIIQRKIIQLTSCIGETSSSCGKHMLYALCNDGTVWAKDVSSYTDRWNRVNITTVLAGD